MKKLTILIAILVAIGGCSKEVPSDQLVERGGVYYEVNSQTPFTGTLVDYTEKGQLWAKGNYIDGKEDGLHERYHVNGQLESTRNWKDGKQLKETEYIYHENGQLKTKRNYKDGKANGLYETYYKNGQLEYKGNYKNGKRDGLWESYHENGQFRWKGNYKDGEEIALPNSPN